MAGVLALVSGTVFYLTLRFRHTLTWWSLGGAGSVYFAHLAYVFLYAGRPSRNESGDRGLEARPPSRSPSRSNATTR